LLQTYKDVTNFQLFMDPLTHTKNWPDIFVFQSGQYIHEMTSVGTMLTVNVRKFRQGHGRNRRTQTNHLLCSDRNFISETQKCLISLGNKVHSSKLYSNIR
jgi:hypothetical protein